MNSEKADKLIPFAAFAVLAFLYLAFLNHRYFVDGLNVAWILETQDKLAVHPHHPLFPLLPQILYQMLGGIGSGSDALGLVIIWSLVFGIFTLWGVQFILKSSGLPLAAVLWAIFLFAFSNGFWYFCTTPNQYSMTLAFQVFTLIIMVPIASGKTGLTTGKAWIIAILTGLAMLSHQVNALMLLPILYFSLTSRNRLINLAITVGGAILVTVVVTIITGVFLEGNSSVSEFIAWQKSYVTRSMYWADNPLDSIVRSFRGIIENHLAHAFHSEGLFGDWQDSFGSPLWYWRLLLRISQAFVLVFLLYLTIRSGIDWYKNRPRNPLQTLGLLFALPFFIFCFFFTPDSTNYRIFYLPGFILFLAPGTSELFHLRKLDYKRAWVLILLILTLFCTNFITKYLPESDATKNPYISEATFLAQSIGPGDLVVYSGTGDDFLRMHYFKYYTHAEATFLPELIEIVRNNPDALIEDIQKRTDEGFFILIHEDAITSPEEVHAVNDLYGTNIGDTELLDFLNEYVRLSSILDVNDNRYLVIEPIDDDTVDRIPHSNFINDGQSD